MAQLSVPADLATNTRNALRRSSPEAEAFLELAGAGVPWRPARVRGLLRWAGRRRVLVDGRRHLVMMLAGFIDAERPTRMRAAIALLRQAAADVAAGREGEAFVGEGVIPLTDDPPSINWDAFWSVPDPWGIGAGGQAQRYPSPADGMVPPAVSAPPPTPAPRPAMPGPRPQPARGGWLTRSMLTR